MRKLGPAPSVGFFERNARERIKRLSMEHAKSFESFVCFAPKRLKWRRWMVDSIIFLFISIFRWVLLEKSIFINYWFIKWTSTRSWTILIHQIELKFAQNKCLCLYLCLVLFIFSKIKVKLLVKNIVQSRVEFVGKYAFLELLFDVGANSSDIRRF